MVAEASGVVPRMSLATKVVHDKENNTISLGNYQLQPVMLTNIKREPIKPTTWPRRLNRQ
jgi:hypothetical protein